MPSLGPELVTLATNPMYEGSTPPSLGRGAAAVQPGAGGHADAAVEPPDYATVDEDAPHKGTELLEDTVWATATPSNGRDEQHCASGSDAQYCSTDEDMWRRGTQLSLYSAPSEPGEFRTGARFARRCRCQPGVIPRIV